MKTKIKNYTASLFTVALASCGAMKVWADGPEVAYLDWDAENKVMTNATCETYTLVTPETQTLESGWYVVDGSVESTTGGIVVNGTVHLILADGAELKVSGDKTKRSAGIEVSPSNSLTIYGQPGNTGRLIATGDYYGAGIGGGATENGAKTDAGTVAINGGTVEVQGGAYGAGIGGAHNKNGGTVTVNGGIVRAQGGSYSAGIGGGMRGQGGNVKINGGEVTANGVSAIGPTNYAGDKYNPGTIEFAATLAGEVLVGSASDSAMLMSKAEYAGDHLARYVRFPSVGIVIPQIGVACAVSDGTETVPPISYNGFISYCTTNHATLTASFAAAQGYTVVQEAPENPKTVGDVVGIVKLTAADLPVVKSQVQLELEDIFDADHLGTVVETVHKNGQLTGHTVTLGRDYGTLAFSNDFGKVTIDLNGWSIKGADGADSATGLTAGGNGGAAIVINGNCGAAMGTTALTVTNDTAAAEGRPASGSGDCAGIFGGNGGAGMPVGRGAEAIVNGSGAKVSATDPLGLVVKGSDGAAGGTTGHPWKVGENGGQPQAYTNGIGQLVISGLGTVAVKPWLDESVKGTIDEVAVTNPETEIPADAFAGMGSDADPVVLDLPEGWRGALPDADGNWFGAKVTIETWPYMVRNLKFQQRYPWNGFVDISADVYGPAGAVALTVQVLSGAEVLAFDTVQGETTVDPENGRKPVKLVWDAQKDIGPRADRLTDVRVRIALPMGETDPDDAVLVERIEPGVTLDAKNIVVGAKCDADGLLEIPVSAKGLAKGVLADPSIKVVNFLSYRTSISLQAWDKSGFSSEQIPTVKVCGSVPSAYYRKNGGTYSNIRTAVAYHWLSGEAAVLSIPFDQAGEGAESAPGWLDLAEGPFRYVKGNEVITADPAWGEAVEATVAWPGEATPRSYTAATAEAWDVSALASGRYDFTFAAGSANYSARFWKIGEDWRILDLDEIAENLRLDEGVSYLVVGRIPLGDGVRLVVPNDTRLAFDENSGFVPGAGSEIVAPAFRQVTDETGLVTLKLLPQPVVSNLDFRQRYPWNGNVDITFDLATDQDTPEATVAETYYAKLTASVNEVPVALGDAIVEGGDPLVNGVFRAQTGKVHVIWNAEADLPAGLKGELKMKLDVSHAEL